MGSLKETQGRHETYATVIEVIVLLLLAVSSYTEVYVSLVWTYNFIHVPMYILLNLVMLYSVVKMRFAIKSMPNLFPNENLVVVHVLLFTAVGALWIVERVFTTRNHKAKEAYKQDPSEENNQAWFYSSYDLLIPQIAYNIVETLLDLFMLYMLHKLSVFKGFVTDPLTGEEIPVLSMFQTAKVMEEGMMDRVLSDKQRA